MKTKVVAVALLFAVAVPAAAALGVLVSSSTKTVGGQLYWSCIYDVLGTRVEQLIPLSAGPCPPTINM